MTDHVRERLLYCQPYPKARQCKSKLWEWIACHVGGRMVRYVQCTYVLYGPEKTKRKKSNEKTSRIQYSTVYVTRIRSIMPVENISIDRSDQI